MSSTEQKYPKIGLALGSGAAKAICQLGILKRIVQEDIKISYVMGSSAGAVLGGFFALGLDINETIEKMLKYVKENNVGDFSNLNFFHESIFKKDFSKKFLKEVFGDKTFADCKIPFAVTAVDLESGKEVLLNQGYLWEAIRASTSIPGIFAPVFLNGHYLVDGGLLEDTPVTSMRQYANCDIVIGSTIQDLKNKQFISAAIYEKFYKKNTEGGVIKKNINKIKTDLKLFASIISRSINILRDALYVYKIAEAKPDILIKMSSEDVSIFDFDRTQELIQLGERSFDLYLPDILKLIDDKIKQLNQDGKNDNLQ